LSEALYRLLDDLRKVRMKGVRSKLHQIWHEFVLWESSDPSANCNRDHTVRMKRAIAIARSNVSCFKT
jgi:hypothetical protein